MIYGSNRVSYLPRERISKVQEAEMGTQKETQWERLSLEQRRRVIAMLVAMLLAYLEAETEGQDEPS